jgi:hypothetical protein
LDELLPRADAEHRRWRGILDESRGAHGIGAGRIKAGMPEDAFYGSGNLGQRVVIIPSERLVVGSAWSDTRAGFDMRGLLRLIRDTSKAFKNPHSARSG